MHFTCFSDPPLNHLLIKRVVSQSCQDHKVGNIKKDPIHSSYLSPHSMILSGGGGGIIGFIATAGSLYNILIKL